MRRVHRGRLVWRRRFSPVTKHHTTHTISTNQGHCIDRSGVVRWCCCLPLHRLRLVSLQTSSLALPKTTSFVRCPRCRWPRALSSQLLQNDVRKRKTSNMAVVVFVCRRANGKAGQTREGCADDTTTCIKWKAGKWVVLFSVGCCRAGMWV